MPFFEFECKSCGARFDLFLKISQRDGKGETCPECGSDAIARQISAPAIGVSSSGPTCAPSCAESG